MKVIILNDVRGGHPFIDSSTQDPTEHGVVKAGIHEAYMNLHGAVSCISDKGKKIGIMLDEFEFLSEEDRQEWLAIAHPNIPRVKS